MSHHEYDGLSRRDAIGMIRRSINDERKGRRWNTTTEGRQANVDLIERTIEDDSAPLVFRLMAAKIHLGIEAQNQADERLAMAEGVGEEKEAQQVILVLPSNGSEVKGAGE